MNVCGRNFKPQIAVMTGFETEVAPAGGEQAEKFFLHQAVPQRDYFPGGKNTRVRTSMLSRGAASAGLVGSSNALCAVKRARCSSES